MTEAHQVEFFRGRFPFILFLILILLFFGDD